MKNLIILNILNRFPEGEKDELLITLDPIDGTRAYLDNLPCFSIIKNSK